MNWMTAIGLVAAVCTTSSFLPQAIKTIKTKQTQDISLGMYIILTTGVLLWLVYGILIEDLPLIVSNIVSFLFIGTILILKIKYK